MGKFEELKSLVGSLKISEKRFVKILGKARSGGKGSQLLDLFDQLNDGKAKRSGQPASSLPANFPTLALRLEGLILESLRLLNAGKSVDGEMTRAIDQVVLLRSRKLYAAALRVLEKAKQKALAFSRYTVALQFLSMEREIQLLARPKHLRSLLTNIRASEEACRGRMEQLSELEHLHGLFRTVTRQVLVPRKPGEMEEIEAIMQTPILLQPTPFEGFIEQAMAGNIIGLNQLVHGDPEGAFHTYLALVEAWAAHPKWVKDQSQLFLWIVNNYLIAVLYNPAIVQEVQHYLDLIPQPDHLPPESAVPFQRMVFQNRFHLALNQGQFDLVRQTIQENEAWIGTVKRHLHEQNLLAFYHNFAIAQFLYGDYREAHRHVRAILTLPGREVRKDIRDFARILEVILHYEFGNDALNEYLSRSGRRYFKSNPQEWDFETTTLKYLEKATKVPAGPEKQAVFEELSEKIDALMQVSRGRIPLTGMQETSIWVMSKVQDTPIRTVFLQFIQAHLEK